MTQLANAIDSTHEGMSLRQTTREICAIVAVKLAVSPAQAPRALYAVTLR